MNYQAAGERHGLSENQGAPCGFPSGGGSSCARVGVYQNRSLMRARSRLEKVGIDGLLLALRGAHDGDTTRHDDTAGGAPYPTDHGPGLSAAVSASLDGQRADSQNHRTTDWTAESVQLSTRKSGTEPAGIGLSRLLPTLGILHGDPADWTAEP